MTSEKDISLKLAEQRISAGQDLHGTIFVNYSGRIDSIVINSQIENSNDGFTYDSLNGKKINYPYSRLSILKSELGDRRSLEFIARTGHIPEKEFSKAKIRVAVIQEHKEVASDAVYLEIVRHLSS